MATTKDERFYVRVSTRIKREFELIAKYRGLTPSAMLHSFIVKTVNEAKEESPQIFKGSEEVIELGEVKTDDGKKKGKKK